MEILRTINKIIKKFMCWLMPQPRLGVNVRTGRPYGWKAAVGSCWMIASSRMAAVW